VNLDRVPSADGALVSMSIERRPGTPVHTNLFASRDRIEEWIDDDSLYRLAGDGASALLRRDRDFFHVYLTFVDPDGARALLDRLPADEILVTDVVGDGERDRPVTEVFEDAGYRLHRLLRRLKRRPSDLEAPAADSLRPADPSDTTWILEMLEAHFDRFSEQLPTRRQLDRAVATDSITLAVVDGSRAGFLYDESAGRRSTLRYWFVAPEWRDARVGARLLRHHVATRCAGKTSELWVVDDNENAIKRYLHYGYEGDVLTNRVLMRGRDTDGS
jgi:hypothetical protein